MKSVKYTYASVLLELRKTYIALVFIYFNFFANFYCLNSVLLKRGADCCLEDGNGLLPDDIARQHMCYDCEQLIESHRKHRTEHIFKLVDNVRA